MRRLAGTPLDPSRMGFAGSLLGLPKSCWVAGTTTGSQCFAPTSDRIAVTLSMAAIG